MLSAFSARQPAAGSGAETNRPVRSVRMARRAPSDPRAAPLRLAALHHRIVTIFLEDNVHSVESDCTREKISCRLTATIPFAKLSVTSLYVHRFDDS